MEKARMKLLLAKTIFWGTIVTMSLAALAMIGSLIWFVISIMPPNAWIVIAIGFLVILAISLMAMAFGWAEKTIEKSARYKN
jgi:uncharacterized membrane protein YeiH